MVHILSLSYQFVPAMCWESFKMAYVCPLVLSVFQEQCCKNTTDYLGHFKLCENEKSKGIMSNEGVLIKIRQFALLCSQEGNEVRF